MVLLNHKASTSTKFSRVTTWLPSALSTYLPYLLLTYISPLSLQSCEATWNLWFYWIIKHPTSTKYSLVTSWLTSPLSPFSTYLPYILSTYISPLSLQSCEATRDLLLLNHKASYINKVQSSNTMTQKQLRSLSAEYDGVYFSKVLNDCFCFV